MSRVLLGADSLSSVASPVPAPGLGRGTFLAAVSQFPDGEHGPCHGVAGMLGALAVPSPGRDASSRGQQNQPLGALGFPRLSLMLRGPEACMLLLTASVHGFCRTFIEQIVGLLMLMSRAGP